MAATVGGLVTGMRLLEPGFTPASTPARVIGRLRTSARPEIEDAIDQALKTAGFEVVSLGWDGFARLVGNSPIPLYAQGGLQPGSRATALAYGATGVACPISAAARAADEHRRRRVA